MPLPSPSVGSFTRPTTAAISSDQPIVHQCDDQRQNKGGAGGHG